MFDKIEKKITNIRKQPEHIRIRYVWLAVSITMFLVIFIWLISIRTSFVQVHNDVKSQQNIEDIKKRINKLNPNNNKIENPISIDELLENSTKQNEI